MTNERIKFGPHSPEMKPIFEPFIRDAIAQGFQKWLYYSEFWFEETGYRSLYKMVKTSKIVDKEAGATKDEKKLAAIVLKHFPNIYKSNKFNR